MLRIRLRYLTWKLRALCWVFRRLSLTLVSEKTGEARVYRIVANDVSPQRKGRPGRNAA